MNTAKVNKLTEKLNEARAKVKAIEAAIAAEVSGKPIQPEKPKPTKKAKRQAKPVTEATAKPDQGVSVVDRVKSYFQGLGPGSPVDVETVGRDLELDPKSYRTLLPKLRSQGFLDSTKRGTYVLHSA